MQAAASLRQKEVYGMAAGLLALTNGFFCNHKCKALHMTSGASALCQSLPIWILNMSQ